ncbi:unnamed protein product [Calypogeia fissa]
MWVRPVCRSTPRPRPPIPSGTMLTPVTVTGTPLGFPLTQTPPPKTIVQERCIVGNSPWDACQGPGPFILMSEPRISVTLKQNGVISLLQVVLTKDHSRARKTRKCIFGRRGSLEHLT